MDWRYLWRRRWIHSTCGVLENCSIKYWERNRAKGMTTWLKCFWCLLHFFCAFVVVSTFSSSSFQSLASPCPALVYISQCTRAREEDDDRRRDDEEIRRERKRQKALVSLLSLLTLPCFRLSSDRHVDRRAASHSAADHKVLAPSRTKREDEKVRRREFDHFSNLSLSKCLLWRSV